MLGGRLKSPQANPKIGRFGFETNLTMNGLVLVSLMADNATFFYKELGQYLAPRIGMPVHVADDIAWQKRERMLDGGKAQIGFVCGLQYVQKVDELNADLELLAAPVMKSERYKDLPIYFSDIVVRRESPFHSFGDLRGAYWSYNEPTSHSGCNLVRYYLTNKGENADYFKRVVGSAAHQESLRMLLTGGIEATATDSTMVALELKVRPEIGAELRVIQTLGPSPIPPAVISRSVPKSVRHSIRNALLRMNERTEGKAILSKALLDRFTIVSDSY